MRPLCLNVSISGSDGDHFIVGMNEVDMETCGLLSGDYLQLRSKRLRDTVVVVNTDRSLRAGEISLPSATALNLRYGLL